MHFRESYYQASLTQKKPPTVWWTCFIHAVVLSFSENAQGDLSGYMKASVFCWLLNIVLWCTVEGPATIAGYSRVQLFCCLGREGWLQATCEVDFVPFILFCFLLQATEKKRIEAKCILLNSNPVWDPENVLYNTWCVKESKCWLLRHYYLKILHNYQQQCEL